MKNVFYYQGNLLKPDIPFQKCRNRHFVRGI